MISWAGSTVYLVKPEWISSGLRMWIPFESYSCVSSPFFIKVVLVLGLRVHEV